MSRPKLQGDQPLQVGDRALTPLWPDRPVVLESLKPDTPPILGFDCTIRLEDCGQRLPYRIADLTPIGPTLENQP